MGKMQSFTKRQQVLLDRLITLGQWFAEKKLPVAVLEAYGFGSFFRGKGRPHDVDILLRCSGEDTDEFRFFSRLLDKACRGSHSRRFKTPQAALLHAFDQHYNNLFPGFIDADPQRSLFAQWIEGYTWNMLSTSDMIREKVLRSATEIARRFVKRHLPNLNIVWSIGPDDSPEKCGLRAAFVVLFWSKEKPDVRANVEHALLDSQRHKPILEELAQFDQDLFRIETQIDLVKKTVERLLRTPRSRKAAESSHAWLEAWAKRQKGVNARALERAISSNNLMSQEILIERLGLEYPQASYNGLSVGQVSELVEEKRSRLKQLRHYLEIAQEATSVLVWYKSGQYSPEHTAKDSLATHFLEGKNEDWWKKGHAVLADLGIDIPWNQINASWERWNSRRPLRVIAPPDDDQVSDHGGDQPPS